MSPAEGPHRAWRLTGGNRQRSAAAAASKASRWLLRSLLVASVAASAAASAGTPGAEPLAPADQRVLAAVRESLLWSGLRAVARKTDYCIATPCAYEKK